MRAFLFDALKFILCTTVATLAVYGVAKLILGV